MKIIKIVDEAIELLMKFLIIASILIMVAILFAGVIARVFFRESIVSSSEIANYCITIVTFGCASYVARLDKQVRISYLFDRAKWGVKRVWGMIINLGMAFISSYMAYHSFIYGINIMNVGSRTSVLGVPTSINIFIVAVGLTLLALEYFIELILTIVNKDKIYIGREPLVKEVDA